MRHMISFIIILKADKAHSLFGHRSSTPSAQSAAVNTTLLDSRHVTADFGSTWLSNGVLAAPRGPRGTGSGPGVFARWLHMDIESGAGFH